MFPKRRFDFIKAKVVPMDHFDHQAQAVLKAIAEAMSAIRLNDTIVNDLAQGLRNADGLRQQEELKNTPDKVYAAKLDSFYHKKYVELRDAARYLISIKQLNGEWLHALDQLSNLAKDTNPADY